MEIEFDPIKAQTNLRKHHVSFSHAKQALHDPLAITIEDSESKGEQRFITLGMDALGRILVTVFILIAERKFALSPHVKQAEAKWSFTMHKEYDFSKERRGAVLKSPGKTRITIMLDDDIIEFFRAKAEANGTGYQTMINKVLRSSIAQASSKSSEEPLTIENLRKVLREELHTA